MKSKKEKEKEKLFKDKFKYYLNGRGLSIEEADKKAKKYVNWAYK